MRQLSTVSRRSLLALILLVPFVNGGCGCGAPAKTPVQYSALVSTFTIGTLALETSDPTHTQTYLTKMTTMAPEEPAGWANLGLFQLRSNQLELARQSLTKARELAGNDTPAQAREVAGIEKLLAMLGADAFETAEIDSIESATKSSHLEFRIPLKSFRRIPVVSMN